MFDFFVNYIQFAIYYCIFKNEPNHLTWFLAQGSGPDSTLGFSGQHDEFGFWFGFVRLGRNRHLRELIRSTSLGSWLVISVSYVESTSDVKYTQNFGSYIVGPAEGWRIFEGRVAVWCGLSDWYTPLEMPKQVVTRPINPEHSWINPTRPNFYMDSIFKFERSL